MKKYLNILVCILILFSSCMKEDFPKDGMTDQQRSLIGRAVNFNTSMAELFITKASYDNGGGFNHGDFLTIYREYLDPATNTFGSQDYRVYHRYQEYIPGTNYAIGDPKWKPLAGKIGYNSEEDSQHRVGKFTQTEADSLTWDNGQTVRYRAVGRSNYAGTIGSASGSNKGYYYPDYTYCEWVTASGPTNDVAFVMKHLGARIIVTPRNGNIIKKVEITTDWQDYKYADNSDKLDADLAESYTRTDDEAKAMADSVKEVYDKMCLPAGVDPETGMLKAMTSAYYNSVDNFYNLETVGEPDDIVLYGSKSPQFIAESVQRPVFNQINTNNFILISNPYNLSDTDSGKPLILPKCTRFRVYIYDVNSGDASSSGVDGWEKTYHILDLADVTIGDDPAFPNGLELIAGDSHSFQVGYRYDMFTVSVENSNLSWTEQTEYSGTATEDTVDKPNSFDYQWWIDGMKLAEPSFTIADVSDFLEFIQLVNGTASSVAEDLKQEYREIRRPNGTLDEANTGYWWYTLNAKGEKVWYGKAGTETPFSTGDIPDEFSDHIFYQHWVLKEGTAVKELRWDYIRDAFSFCDEAAMKPYTVKLAADLDLCNWRTDAIGSDSTPFKGVFNGQGHLLSNLNVREEYLFGRIDRADIRNLRIVSLNNTALVNRGTDANFILGVSIEAPCSGSSIANSLIGTVGESRNDSYIVGCIHVGKSGAAMVGSSDALEMLGCMEAGWDIPNGTPALLGSYAGSFNFFDPQRLEVIRFDDFMCNYFDTQLSPGTLAAPGQGTLKYSHQEYIRGLKTSLLMARNDYFISDKTPYEYLTDSQRLAFYGLAPYKAMDYAIWRYNTSVSAGLQHKCEMHYEVDNTGFDYRYPTLVAGAPQLTSAQQKDWNVLNQNN